MSAGIRMPVVVILETLRSFTEEVFILTVISLGRTSRAAIITSMST